MGVAQNIISNPWNKLPENRCPLAMVSSSVNRCVIVPLNPGVYPRDEVQGNR